MNRTPPREVLEKLRKEVNFGCPVPECGTPYLTWHHFDPSWSVKEHHNPEGMIALCPTHAALADGNRWTKEQLREMKRNPFVTSDKITDFYGYLRKSVVCIIGNVAYQVRNVLEINGERVIGFEKDNEGYDRLNLLVRNREGSPILVMENNLWTAYSNEMYDLRCSTQGKELVIISKDGHTNLKIRFDDHTISEFRDILSEGCPKNSIEWFVSEIGNPTTVPTWSIKGRLRWGNSELDIRNFEIEDERHNIFRMNFIVKRRTAFSFNSNLTTVG